MAGGAAERGAAAPGVREQEQHCGMRGRTAGQLRPELGLGTLPGDTAWPGDTGLAPWHWHTSAQGRWPGPTAALEPTEPTFLTALPDAGALVLSISECVMLC